MPTAMPTTASTPQKYRVRAYVGTTTAPSTAPMWLEGPPRLTVALALEGFAEALLTRHLRGAFAVRAIIVSGPSDRPDERLDLVTALIEVASACTHIRSVVDPSGHELHIEHLPTARSANPK